MHKIELVKHPKYRGSKVIMVDEVEWGIAKRRAIGGGRGDAYEFIQTGSSGFLRRGNERLVGSLRGRVIVVYSDAHARRIRRDIDPMPGPLEERLLAEIQSMITDGILRHPDSIRSEAKQRATEREDRLREEREADEKRFREKAMEHLNAAFGLGALSSEDYQVATTEIVAAMRWAQQQ